MVVVVVVVVAAAVAARGDATKRVGTSECVRSGNGPGRSRFR